MADVSIIVPVYNQEQYLRKCLDSILEQTYKEFECILVDDGSTDKSSKICDEYAANDTRIRVIHKKNEGASIARKVGFDVSNAEYVCFLDSDDYLAPSFVEVMFNKTIDEKADVCTCGHYQFIDNCVIEDTYDYKNPVILKDSMLEQYLLPIIGKIYKDGYVNYPGYIWGRMYKKSIIDERCFVSERLCLPEDDLFHMYLIPNISKAIFIEDKLVYYRINEASLTHSYRSNMWKRLKNRHELVVKFLNEYSQTKEIKDRVWASGFFSVYVALKNAYGLDSYEAFKAEMREVLNDSLAKSILKETSCELITPRQKLMVALLKMHMYRGLFGAKKILF